MNQEQINITGDAVSDEFTMSRKDFLRLLVAERAAEREECAQVCHDYATRHGLKGGDNEKAQAWMMLQCAAAIRARGTIRE